MKLSVRAMAVTSGLLWGGGLLACGLVNLAAPPYGRRFLRMMSSVYPGFHNSRTLADVLVGAGYGFVDGAAAGAVFAGLYNRAIQSKPESRKSARPAAVAAGEPVPAV